ncbi:MAG: polyphosphate kinase 1 [Chloroflexi bacterium CFX4]|nr:polyphosphate kinase 1 [Chloroflexi bacterium CFX4]MDL1921367.1 polyphosphate kinase 1 [Chloroflexi bacterium CFX3]
MFPAAPPQPPEPPDPTLYINRELSWLEFNRRCLLEAFNPELPLLERVRFLSIFSNNLDEFYMVRVSGLKDQVAHGIYDPPPDGLTPQAQLAAIREKVLPMLHQKREHLLDELLPRLAEVGVQVLDYTALDEADRQAMRRYFEVEIFPVLTPLAVDPGRPFPHISNLSLNLAVMLSDAYGVERFARVKVPNTFPRLIALNEVHKLYGSAHDPLVHRFVWLEQVIAANLDLLFHGMRVLAASAFRVTRNNDIEIAEEEASDLLESVEEVVRARRFGPVVRLDAADTMPESIRNLLLYNMEITPDDLYVLREPLGMRDLAELANLDLPALKHTPYTPSRPASLPAGGDIFAAIRRGDILLHHPYESFSPIVEFFQQAAEDPNVLAIKCTLYRIGSKSPIVEALLNAIENGKQVAALVELKARFDEENNIGWARALESAGVHVVYGLVGLKTHAKVSLVIRKEQDGMRRYVHLSTGNYNATTARIYTDLGLLTCDPHIGADATLLFNRLTGFTNNAMYQKLLVAPEHLRPAIYALIRREIDHARAGREARMILKMNALVDQRMVSLLYEASQAGVQVDLIVRGICCLRPGVAGVSENIRVRCLIGRYLEHARIYYFANGGAAEIYCGSADLMPRNLDRRVETWFPVHAPELQQRLLDEILGIELADTAKARYLLPDGSYERVLPAEGEPPLDAQRWFMEHARDR